MALDYIIPASRKRTGNVLLSDSDDPNHFHKDCFGAGKLELFDRVDYEALMAKGGPEAEHFVRIRDWARRRVAA